MYDRYGFRFILMIRSGKSLSKRDVTGKDVYRYETLDLVMGIYIVQPPHVYLHEYMTDPEEQLKALGIIEDYLKLAAKPLLAVFFL